MAEEFKGSRMFLNIPVSVSRDHDLLKRPKSIILMGEIVSMLNITGKFFMSNKEIAKRLDCTPRYASDLLALLEKKGFIKRSIIFEDADKKIIKGRNIYAGDNLLKACSLGWGSTVQEGDDAQFIPLTKHSSSKKNILREHNNRSINNLSPKPSHAEKSKQAVDNSKEKYERDKKLNQVINYYQKMLDEYHPELEFNEIRSVTPLSITEKDKLLKAIKSYSFEELKQEIETAAIYTSSNPISYLTSCINNKKPKAKLTDLQKKLFSGKTMIQQGEISNGFNSGY